MVTLLTIESSNNADEEEKKIFGFDIKTKLQSTATNTQLILYNIHYFTVFDRNLCKGYFQHKQVVHFHSRLTQPFPEETKRNKEIAQN